MLYQYGYSTDTTIYFIGSGVLSLTSKDIKSVSIWPNGQMAIWGKSGLDSTLF